MPPVKSAAGCPKDQRNTPVVSSVQRFAFGFPAGAKLGSEPGIRGNKVKGVVGVSEAQRRAKKAGH